MVSVVVGVELVEDEDDDVAAELGVVSGELVSDGVTELAVDVEVGSVVDEAGLVVVLETKTVMSHLLIYSG